MSVFSELVPVLVNRARAAGVSLKLSSLRDLLSYALVNLPYNRAVFSERQGRLPAWTLPPVHLAAAADRYQLDHELLRQVFEVELGSDAVSPSASAAPTDPLASAIHEAITQDRFVVVLDTRPTNATRDAVNQALGSQVTLALTSLTETGSQQVALAPFAGVREASELAQRLMELLDLKERTNGDGAYTQGVVTAIAQTVIDSGKPLELQALRRALADGVEEVVIRAVEALMERQPANPELGKSLRGFLQKMKAPTQYCRAVAHVNFYCEVLAQHTRSSAIDVLVSHFNAGPVGLQRVAALSAHLNLLCVGATNRVIDCVSPASAHGSDVESGSVRQSIMELARTHRLWCIDADLIDEPVMARNLLVLCLNALRDLLRSSDAPKLTLFVIGEPALYRSDLDALLHRLRRQGAETPWDPRREQEARRREAERLALEAA